MNELWDRNKGRRRPTVAGATLLASNEQSNTKSAACQIVGRHPQQLERKPRTSRFGNAACAWYFRLECTCRYLLNGSVRFRPSPVPVKRNTEPDHRPNLPLFTPACFVKCPAIRKMVGRGGGDRTHMRKNPRRIFMPSMAFAARTRRFGAVTSGLRSGLSLHRPPESPGLRREKARIGLHSQITDRIKSTCLSCDRNVTKPYLF